MYLFKFKSKEKFFLLNPIATNRIRSVHYSLFIQTVFEQDFQTNFPMLQK